MQMEQTQLGRVGVPAPFMIFFNVLYYWESCKAMNFYDIIIFLPHLVISICVSYYVELHNAMTIQWDCNILLSKDIYVV